MIVGRTINYRRLRNPVAAHRARVSDPLRALIAQLYGNGEQGAMYVPQPVVLGQQVLYQNAAGTVPVTADGDPVGRNDDVSGIGNHATQPVSADRPLYKTDGTLHWLEGNGTNQFIKAGPFTLGEGWFVAWAGVRDTHTNFDGPWRFLREGGDPDGTSDNRLEEYAFGGPKDRRIVSRYAAQGNNLTGADGNGALPGFGTPVVAWANRSPGVEIAIGHEYTGSDTTEISVSDLPYSVGTAELHIFRGYSGDFMGGRINGFVFINGGASIAQRKAAVDYLKTLVGIS